MIAPDSLLLSTSLVPRPQIHGIGPVPDRVELSHEACTVVSTRKAGNERIGKLDVTCSPPPRRNHRAQSGPRSY